MLIQKVEKMKVTLNPKNIKNYKRTCREFNKKYNDVLNKLLTNKYSLPTGQEWDNLISEINKLRREINSLKSKKKTEEEIFQESLRVFKESQGKLVDESNEENDQIDLINKEERLKTLLEYKNNLHISANNSNITIATIRYLLGSYKFDSALKSYFERILTTTIDRFKAKPKNKERTEFNKPLAGLPKYRKRNQYISLEFVNTRYKFLRNNKKKIMGIKLGKTFKNISLRDNFSYEFINNNVKINNIALTPVSDYSIIDGKFYLLINYEYNKLMPLPDFKTKVGIDRGLSDLVITSDGEKFKYPENSIEKIEKKRTRLQSLLSIKKTKNKHWKRSNRYKKLKSRVDKLYAKEKYIRENFYHQVSRYLLNKYDIITVEDLNVSGMLQNKNLSQKISNASWNRLAVFLDYKSRNENKVFRKAYRFYASTRICHNCKAEYKKFKGLQTLNIRDWICPNCRTHHDRVINAALNIRDWEPKSDDAISRTDKTIAKVRRSQIRDFTNWIVFALYLDKLRKDKTGQFLNELLRVTNLKTISIEENSYINEILKKDKNRKNKKYQLALNKLDELNKIKRIDKMENEINFKNLKRYVLD